MPLWGAPIQGQHHRRTFEAAAIVALVASILIYYHTRYPGMAAARAIEEVRSLLAGAHLSKDADRLRLSSFTNPPHLSTLLPEVPAASATTAASGPSSRSSRLIVIGDVHGQLGCLQALLAEAGYSAAQGDRVVLAGDIINKGPDSAGVTALAMAEGFAAVRGNHEDKVLRVFALAEAVRAEAEAAGRGSGEAALAEWEQTALSKSDRAALAVARSLTPEQRDWIAARPLLLRLDARAIVLGRGPGAGAEGSAETPRDEVVVVHAGVVPGVPLEDQDPWALMSMRTLLYPGKKGKLHGEDRSVFEVAVRTKLKDLHPTAAPPSDAEVEAESRRLLEYYCSHSHAHADDRNAHNENGGDDSAAAKRKDDIPVAVPVATREGRSWAKAWDEIQRAKSAGEGRTTVVYGHDARKGLNVKEYTFGLDSGCVKGGRLTALVFEADEAAETGVGRRLVSVGCEAVDSEAEGKEGEGKGGKKDKKDKKDKKEKKKEEEN